MVTHPGAALGAAHLRAVNLPRLLSVQADAAGQPRAVTLGGSTLAVASIEDCWRIDEEWWQQPLTRQYFLLALEDGRLLTVFHDLVGRQWFRQNYL